MNQIISEVLKELKKKLQEIFQKPGMRIAEAEHVLGEVVSGSVLELLSGYYEAQDRLLLEDKAGRHAAGLVVERRDVNRRVLTTLGELNVSRTYYRKASGGGYCFPADEQMGLERYERVSGGVSHALVDAARTLSYQQSSEMVCCGAVSKQTVLNKIRQSTPVYPQMERRRVAVLHVDADEDHVNLQHGGNTIVPLLSAYEGIHRKGKRGSCVNVFHYSRYGEKPDTLWEGFLNELEQRYDLSGTKIYLHGDGASWIRAGLEWLPNGTYALDHYHKNKAVKETLRGITGQNRKECEAALRTALKDGDKELLTTVCDSMASQWPEHGESIRKGGSYLLDNLDGIRVYSTDPESCNGGATEPHISHVLSARLSSRPKGWSKATLRRFAPVLAAGSCLLGKEAPDELVPFKVIRFPRKHHTRVLPFALGLPHPDSISRLLARSGKVTPISTALKPF